MNTDASPLPHVARRVGRVLLGAGALVGAAAVIAYATGFRPELSPWLERVLLFKVLLGGGIGMGVLGAWLLRAARRVDDTPSPPPALPAEEWKGIARDGQPRRERSPVERSDD